MEIGALTEEAAKDKSELSLTHVNAHRTSITRQPDEIPVAERGAVHWSAFLGEALVAISMALVLVTLSRSIEINPLDRIGQVSGLAALDLRFVLLGLLVLAVAIGAATITSPRLFSLVHRLSCAAVAGLATGLIGGGVVLALRGTTWPLNANLGDAGRLAAWAGSRVAGGTVPAEYPPMSIHLIAWVSELTAASPSYTLRAFQIVGTALFGPVVYLSWRLLLRPAWALGIGLITALPLIDPYKPYTNIVFIVLLPITIRFLQLLRRVDAASWRRIALCGAGTGCAAGLLFLTYSGWFVWSAVGVCATVLVVFPWRTGLGRGLVLLGVAGATFLGITSSYLVNMLRAAGNARDTYFFFDTYVEPAYIAMWRGDTPGDAGPWPPPGELAGVGFFTVLLVVGLGAAIALAGRRTVIIMLSCCLANAWLLRFWLASQMYETQSVQLYPRTTLEILYILLLLFGFAVYFALRRFGRSWISPPGRSMTIGFLCAVLLFFLFAGSATADRYLPRSDNSLGTLAYHAQLIRQEDGHCSAYSRPDRCVADWADLMKRLAAGH